MVGTSYSVYAFRTLYGFDFGHWLEDGYVFLIVATQITTVFFANYLTVSLHYKSNKLQKVAVSPAGFAL